MASVVVVDVAGGVVGVWWCLVWGGGGELASRRGSGVFGACFERFGLVVCGVFVGIGLAT